MVLEKTRGLDIPAPLVEVPTEPPRELDEPSRDDLDDGIDTGGQSILPEEPGETSVINRKRRGIKFVDGKRIIDSRLWPKSLTRKLLEVLSS